MTTTPLPIQACFFDVFGTLVDWRGPTALAAKADLPGARISFIYQD